MASQRISGGFHRLAVFLAGIPLLIGLWVAFMDAQPSAERAARLHAYHDCAHKYVTTKRFEIDDHGTVREMGWEEAREFVESKGGGPAWFGSGGRLNLKAIGCSTLDYDTISVAEAREPPTAIRDGTLWHMETWLLF